MSKLLKFFSLILLSVLMSCQKIDKLNDSDKIDLVRFIINENKIECLNDVPYKFDINANQPEIGYISNFPFIIQKTWHLKPKVNLIRLFRHRDLKNYRKQIKSLDSTFRYSMQIHENLNFIQPNDTLTKCKPYYSITYPLINSKHNAMIVILNWYAGPLAASKKMLFYIKQNNQWIKLEEILLMRS